MVWQSVRVLPSSPQCGVAAGCLVVEGETMVGQVRLRAGDFLAAIVPHLPVTSETGVRFHVRGAA